MSFWLLALVLVFVTGCIGLYKVMSKAEKPTFKEDIFNILHLLSSQGDLTQRDVSNHLEISLGKTNYLLKSLIQKNLIKVMNFSRGKDKLGKVKYILTKRGLKEKVHLAYHFLKKKEMEYNRLRSEWGKLKEELSANGQAIEEGELDHQLKESSDKRK